MRGCIPALSPAGKGSLITWCGRLELFGFQTLKIRSTKGKVLFQAVLDLGKLCLVQIGVQVAEGWGGFGVHAADHIAIRTLR